MEAKFVCVYAKFGRCKKEECEFHHPEDTCCDKTCDIHNCLISVETKNPASFPI